MIKPQTIFTGDNLDIMHGMESESVDLIYIDPPFNSNRNYSAPIGSKAAGAAFKDTWTLSDTDDAWWGEIADEHPSLYKVIDAVGEIGGKGGKAYLIYMAMRLLEMKRLLKPTGSIYYHCDPTMSHSIKLTMDSVFERKNFRNEVIWGYRTQGVSMKNWPKKHDILLCYGGGGDKITFHPMKERLYYKKPFRHTQIDQEGRHYVDVYVRDVWDDDPQVKALISQAKERTGYPTQKPLALLERIIKASSNEGDIVLDSFCGCATALIAAQKLNRQWIGVDISPVAVQLVKNRLENELGLFADFIHRQDIPVRKKNVKRSKNIKHILYGQQEGECAGCQCWFPFRNLAIDHYVPTSKGGTNDDANLQLLCTPCNSTKGNRTMEFLLASLKEQGVR